MVQLKGGCHNDDTDPNFVGMKDMKCVMACDKTGFSFGLVKEQITFLLW
jgi:polyferredoxin